MAKRKGSSTSRKGASGPSIDLLRGVNPVSSIRALRAGGSGDMARLSITSQPSSKPVQFGSPSNSGSQSSSRTKKAGSWTSLLETMSTGGISDLVGGGGVLSAGLNYLTSGIESLFGGKTKSAPEPLTRFALPDSQDQTLYVTDPQKTIQSSQFSGAYSSSQPIQLGHTSRAEIVQTVKTALLTSSSLNDVIGEL
jgi:hypothetical protein